MINHLERIVLTQITATKLDTYYTRLYGLTHDELRYILDPKEVHGEDFPGETFRVLKEKEVRLYGDASRVTPVLWTPSGVAAVLSEECFAIHLNQIQSYIRENV
jgi:hypothetical protein